MHIISETAPAIIAIFHDLSTEALRMAYTIAIVIENATIETSIALSPNNPVITDWNAFAASSMPWLPKDCEFFEKKESI